MIETDTTNYDKEYFKEIKKLKYTKISDITLF